MSSIFSSSSSSVMKDTLGKATALGQAMGGLFADDEVVKGTMASYTFEHMEISAYKVLVSTAAVLAMPTLPASAKA